MDPLRDLVASLVVGLLCFAAPGRAADVLFFDSEPGDYIGAGIPQRLSDAEATFLAGQNPDRAVAISVMGGAGGPWYLDFAAPLGGELTTGTYEGATRYPFQSPGEPGLSVSGEGRGCNTDTGRFVVLEVSFTPGGDVQRFAADFEQHCEGGPAALHGSIRFHTGDAACQAASDGTPCDDGDACTATSACAAGVCRGAGATPCTAADQCHAAACDPTTGGCVARARPDFAPCDDGDTCTVAESCQGGICTGGVPGISCFDGNPCTADLCHGGGCDFSQPTVCQDDGDFCTQAYCDPVFGCSSRPVVDCCHTNTDCDDGNPCTEDACGADHRCLSEPVPCWAVQGKATITASALGRTAHTARPFSGILILKDDGTYRIPSGACPTTGESLPDEVGTTRPGPRGRLALRANNLDELYGALERCVGQRVRVKSYRAWVKILADLQHLRGAATLLARTRVRGVTVQLQVIERFRGTKISGGFSGRASGTAVLLAATPLPGL